MVLFKVPCKNVRYLDLVLQDTPLNDEKLERNLRQSVYDVNNLADKEQEKYERMQVRFNRTQSFLDYLMEEERREADFFNLAQLPAPLCNIFMRDIILTFQSDREYIEQRLREGRFEDAPDQPDEQIALQFELDITVVEPSEKKEGGL